MLLPELTLDEAEELLLIDKEQLDVICQEQPELFYRIARMYVDMSNLKDGCKDDLKRIEAAIAIEIRTEFEALNKKTTETQINQLVTVSEKRKKAMEHYLHTEQEADTWGILKEAFLQRANMLKILSDLHGQNYFNLACSSNKSVQEQEYQNLRNVISKARTKKGV